MIKTFQLDVAASGTPERLPDEIVDSGLPALIKAKHDNVGRITIGGTYDDAKNDSGACYTMGKNEAVTVKVHNLKEVRIDATNSGDGVEVLIED